MTEIEARMKVRLPAGLSPEERSLLIEIASSGDICGDWPQHACAWERIALAVWSRLGAAGAVINDPFACDFWCSRAIDTPPHKLSVTEWGMALPILTRKLLRLRAAGPA